MSQQNVLLIFATRSAAAGRNAPSVLVKLGCVIPEPRYVHRCPPTCAATNASRSAALSVRPGYESIQYTVRIKGDGTPEQFRQIHDTVCRTSPNYFNVSRPIRLDAELVVEK